MTPWLENVVIAHQGNDRGVLTIARSIAKVVCSLMVALFWSNVTWRWFASSASLLLTPATHSSRSQLLSFFPSHPTPSQAPSLLKPAWYHCLCSNYSGVSTTRRVQSSESTVPLARGRGIHVLWELHKRSYLQSHVHLICCYYPSSCTHPTSKFILHASPKCPILQL